MEETESLIGDILHTYIKNVDVINSHQLYSRITYTNLEHSVYTLFKVYRSNTTFRRCFV